MSTVDNPRVEQIDYGFRVANPDPQVGFLRVYQHPHGQWAAFFDTSTPGDLHPAHGMMGSYADNAEASIRWALS